MNKDQQQIVGYLVGGLLVWGLIPFSIYGFSILLAPLQKIELIPSRGIRYGVVALLFVVGITFGIWSIFMQNKVGKGGPVQIGNLDISPRTENLVVTGPYRYCRNPMLFGACLAYFGYGVFLNTLSAIVAVALFTCFMLVFVKLSEEKRLLKDFGEEYEAYRRRVSMFLPWFLKK